MKLFITLFASLFIAAGVFAQQPVTGNVHDASSNEGLVGAIIVADNGKYHAVADLDGNYQLDLPDGTHKLKVNYAGYNPDSAVIVVAGKPVVHDFVCSNATLKEVEIIADVAIDRKTPVAFSNVSELKIREELGARDMTMLLNSTPGAYATEQGGGAGDSRVSIRGVDQRNIGVMVDGVPMNDMENGQVYWSNWDGLSDVTRTMQVQRGLGASKLAIPSVGGTINILTRGIDNKKSFVVRTDFGNNSMQKLSFMYNSGEFGKGWGVTFAGSRRTGNGWVDQTWDDQWAYFFKVQKRFDKHLLSFSVNGAPQKHAQKYNRLPVGVYDREFANHLGINTDSLYAANNGYTTTTQGPRGRRYNPDWGYLAYSDGQTGIISHDVNFFHKPLFNLSWSYSPNDKLTISSVAYVSIGYGGGTNYNSSSIPRDTLSGQENITSVYNSNHSSIDPIYSSTEHKSSRILYASMNNHLWLGNITTATYKPTKNLSFLFGIDARHYKGSHYRQVYDLVGGDYFVDASDANQPKGTYLGDPNFQYYKKGVGDKIYYWNDSYVDWEGLFAQAEYAVNEKWSAFITGSYSGTQYQRVDHFRKRDIVIGDSIIPMVVGYNETYYTNGTQSAVAQNGAVITTSGDTTIIDNPSGPTYYIPNATGYAWSGENARTATTNKRSFTGYTIKTGVNYNITSHYNVFVNMGYLKMAPRFNTVFDNANREYPATAYQYVKAVELGFGGRYSGFAFNLNLYYTDWKNKPPTSLTISNADGTFFYEIPGLNTTLKGSELDFSWKPLKNLQVEGLASVGDWKINSAGTVPLYDNTTFLLADTITYSAKNIHVGDAAQTQIGGSLRYEPFKGLYIKPRYTFFGKHYANFDPIYLSPVYDVNGTEVRDNSNHESWKMPSYGLLDLFAGYEIREQVAGDKNKVIIVTFNFSVTNVLDTKYISDGQNGGDFGPSTALVFMGMGRRWNAGMRFAF